MKEEILTAEQWVDKYNEDNDSQYSAYDCNYPMMEKYANYKNRILEEKIMEFGKLLKNEQIHATNENITIGNKMHNLLSVYNEHFNIETKQ